LKPEDEGKSDRKENMGITKKEKYKGKKYRN